MTGDAGVADSINVKVMTFVPELPSLTWHRLSKARQYNGATVAK